MRSQALAAALVTAAFLALPLVGVDDYYLHLLVMAGIFFLLAAGMNLLLAAGQLNLGHRLLWDRRVHVRAPRRALRYLAALDDGRGGGGDRGRGGGARPAHPPAP